MRPYAFVTREQELTRLNDHLKQALAGAGQVCFVVGEAGAGKSALVAEFAGQAQEARQDLVVTMGQCDAQTGFGDPYLPFRDVLGQLTGDVDSGLAQGRITRENADRLRKLLRFSGQALVELGPDLVGVIIPGGGLALRAGAFVAEQVGWLKGLERLTERRIESLRDTGIDQTHIFEQYTNVLRSVAQHHPLILILDDLQWADSASINLLFRLGRRLTDSHTLIIGTFRPEEVALGRSGERHPLEKVIAEFTRYRGDIQIDLDQARKAEAQQFVDAILDTEPNNLSQRFREALCEHTEGHPLFTIELLREMQSRGDLVQDEQGQWMEGQTLNWDDLPPRVDGVIGERIGRLEQELREVLTVGSVEGEDFTAEVAARVESLDVRSLIRRLSSELERQHRLVSARGIRRLGPQRLSLYRFEHNLFQSYLYDELDEVLRATLHEDVGLTLEALYGDQADAIAVQLARHFVLAGMDEKAAVYLRRSGEEAAARFANHQAVEYFRRALELGPANEPAEQLALHFDLGRVLAHTGEYDLAVEHLDKVYSSFESVVGEDTTLTQARACYHIGRIYERRGGAENLETALAWQRKGLALLPKTPTAEASLLYALGGIVGIRQFDLDRADRECERSLSLAQAANSKPELALAHRLLSISLRAQGRLEEAMAHCNSSIAICEELTDLMGLATNLSNRGVIAWEMDDWSSAQESYQEAMAIQEQIGDRYQLAMTCCNLADAHAHLGNLEAGITCAKRGLEVYTAIDAPQGVIFARVVMAVLFLRMEAFKNAHNQLLKARRLAEEQADLEFKTTIGRWLAETYLAAGDLNAAEAEVGWLRALGADELASEYEPVERVWGRILSTNGRSAEGQQVLQDSLARLEGRGERYELGCTLLALGELLTQMDGDAAQNHLERARAIFADLGAAFDTQEVDELLAKL